ncbi:hypothetical protein EDB81DRAFT_926519 [Dactylonectria macrodidyma]|uniref:Uncharacterized protein n=1 Tax=Dactylonectria macrodidyma TaxID=307937 RepID=A0A9P9I8K2_9HYPO|nr:hypothetical protein EDB81DRAFT_926519 [Dactylonectria macrodidyma]
MSLAYYFMTKDGTLPRRNYQAEVVDSFCPQSTFKDLQSHSQNLPSRKVCLVDDRTNDGINSISLGDYGPLTAQKLYLKLKEKRFHDRDEHSPEPPNSVSPSSRESPLPLDADRRLVFITDIDRYAVAALMATAPLSQVTALGDTLYMHLAFKAYIGASIQTRGFPFFSLSFHLPYFAWRSTTPQEQPRDNRLNRAGHPVRKVIDVSFLTSGVTPQITFKQGDYLCEAQMSVLVLGPDDCRWTGLCLVDTYFDSEDQRECVDKYHADVPDGIQSDPFTEGIFDVHLPILDPREYFLAVLDCRAKVFMEEWKHSADKLAHRIDGYIAEHPFISKHSTSPPGTELRPFLSCIGQTRQHLREFIECLRAPIRHWDDFKHRERFRTAAECRYISSIQETFVAAGHCLNQLESLCKRCDDLAKYLALCMNDEGSRGMKLQARLTQYNHTLTHVFLYFCFPPILAAGMLSMHEEAIPGVLGPAKQSFIVLTIFLTTLVFIIVGFMQRWRDILLFVYDLVGTERIKIFAGKLTSPGGHDEDIELGGRLQ